MIQKRRSARGNEPSDQPNAYMLLDLDLTYMRLGQEELKPNVRKPRTMAFGPVCYLTNGKPRVPSPGSYFAWLVKRPVHV